MIGDKLIHLPIISSTNDFLRENAEKFTHGTVVVADVQTKGRGRNNRNWSSPEGGLWFSILFKPRKPIKPSFFTKVASVAVHQVLNELGISNSIKWPNDVYVGNKKLCGILTEVIFEGEIPKAIICGIGINVNNEIPQELVDKAISLYQVTNKKHDLKKLLKAILNNINYLVKKYYTKPEALTQVWKRRLMQKEGSEIKFMQEGKIVTGKVVGVEDDHIIVESEGKILKFTSLEVVVA